MNGNNLPGRTELLAFGLALLAACGNDARDEDGRALPSDKQVIADITPANDPDVVDVSVVAGSVGESYLHRDSLVWTFDRGAVVKRRAGLPEVPDAVVVVGGLARYQLVGDRYEFRRFLTTYNEYEGIPAPSRKELTRFVRENVANVFVGREHNILAVDDIELQRDEPWTWHTPNSFTAPFLVSYTERRNNTTLEQRVGIYEIRFYRDSVTSPLRSLLPTETSRSVVDTQTLDARILDGMPTLRTAFR